MQELLGRLRELDLTAADAVSVITYFDSLIESKAGIQAFVRGAAALSHCVVGLEDESRHLLVRVSPQGVALDTGPRGSWESATIGSSGTAHVWLERSGVAEPSDKMILERLSAGVRPVLERTRHTDTHDTASVEVLLDPTTSDADKLGAARRIGLDPSRSARVIAVLGEANARTPQNPRRPQRAMRVGNVLAQIVQGDGLDVAENARVGIGPERELATLAESWRLALLALRFTGDGTTNNPGPTRIGYESLGTLAALAEVTVDGGAAQSDIARLNELEDNQPGALLMLQTLVESESLRQAASKLHVHHSTLQARVPRLESALGYVLDPTGRSRLFASLTVRRIRLNDSLV